MALQFHETFVTYAAETARMGSTKFIYHKLHYQIFSAFLGKFSCGLETLAHPIAPFLQSRNACIEVQPSCLGSTNQFAHQTARIANRVTRVISLRINQ
jgi:hypothetical protein|tara:strand:+ start:402 stop:695 length:294 start_codon:yes stop_codon:yes gene_type:complete